MSKSEIDFTEGRMNAKIFKFVLPLIIAYLIQQAYNSADLIFSGNLLGTDASAAIGSSAVLITLAIGLFGGLSVGVGIMYSSAYGAHDINARARIAKLVLLLSIIVGSILTIVGIIFSPLALSIMQTPPEIMELAINYIRVYFLSIIPMMIFNMTAGMLRAMGNSTYPMIFQSISGGVNVLLDWLFIKFMSDGVVGVALASTIAQLLAAVLTYSYFLRLEKKHFEAHKKMGDLDKYEDVDEALVPKKSGDIVKKIFSTGLPVGVQNMVVTLSNAFVQASINTLSVASISAFTAYYKIELFNYYPIVSFGQATLFIVAQNIGAKRYERIKPSIASLLKMQIPLIAAISVILFIFAEPIFGIFNPDSEVKMLGARLIRMTLPLYWTYAILETLSNAIRSFGKTKTAMMVTLISFTIIRFLMLLVFNLTGHLTLENVALIYPVTWVIAAVVYIIIWLKIRNKKNSNVQQ